MADARRKKVIVFNKDDLRRGADDIRKEFENIKSTGRSSAKGVQEAFESLGKKASTALSEAFDGNSFKGLKDIEESLKIQRKAVDDLTEQYKKAKAEFDSVNIGTQDSNLIAKREKASKLFRESKAELESETNLLKKQEEAFKLISTELQTAGDKSVTFYTQMRQIREEMNKLALAGKDQTPEYDNLRSKLDEVSVAYRKVQQEQKMLAKYGNMLVPGLVQGLSGVSGGFSAFQGVSSLFVKDNEKLAAVQTKLQAAMAITIGLQQVQQTLHKTSAFRVGVVSKVTKAWNVAQTSLNTTLGISAGLMTALATGGVMALVAGVGYLITKYREWNAEQKKLEEITNSYVGALASEQARLDYLFNTYKTAEKGTKEYENAKKGILEQFDKYYQGLDAERLLAERTAEAYQKLATAIRGVAKDKALQETYEKSAKKLLDVEAKALSYVHDLIVKEIGKKDGESLFADIKKEIQETGELSEELKNRMNSNDKLVRADNIFTNSKDKKINVFLLEAEKAAEVIKKAKEEYDKEISQATSVLGIFSDGDDGGKGIEETTGLIAEQKKKLEDLEKKYGDIEKIKDKATLEAYNKEKKAITDTISALEKLGIEEKERGTGKATTFKEAEKQKKEQQKSAEELLTLRRQNQQDEINLMKDGTEKKLKQIELDYQKELDSIRKQESKWSKEQGGKLTQEQSIEISTRYTNAENKKEKDIADVTKEQLKAEQQALNDYLKDYGTFQQQKLAIAQEYAEKIKKAQEENGMNSTQVKLLEKQRDVAIQNKETEAIKANIDWVTVFGEFGGMFNDMVKPALEEAKKYIQTDKFKNSDQASQKALIDAINQMEKSLGGAGGLNFKKLGQDIKTYQIAEQNRIIAIEDEKIAQDKLIKAQEDYEKALKNGTEEEKRAGKDALDIAQQNADTASANVRTQTDIANEIQQNLTNTATNLRTNMNNVVEGLSKLASGGISSAYQGLLQAGSAMKGAIGEVTKNLKDVPIIGWIVAIIDVFKDGLSDVVGGLLDAVFNAVSGILSDVLSGDLFVTLGKSIRDGVGNILNSISFGGWDSLMNKISGSNAKETAEIISKLTSSNEALKVSVDALREEIAGTNGAKSIQAYNEAVNAQQRYNENLRQILDAQMGYHSSHHSNAYYWDLDRNSLNEVNKLLGTSLKNSWSDFSKLTPDQMDEIRKHLPDIWSEMISQGKYGDRFKEDWDNYADQAGKVIEMTESLRENIAQISFDSLRDSFVNALMDMDSDAKDFAGNFEEYMTKALLNFAVGDLLDDQMKEWYESWVDTINKQDGKLTDQQIAQYKKEWDAMVQMGIEKRDEIASLTGYTGKDGSMNQQSSVGVTKTASQDSIDVLDGRLTHVQETNQEISNNSTATLELMRTNFAMLNERMETNRGITLQSMYHLADIVNNTNVLPGMAKDIAEVKRNTKGL